MRVLHINTQLKSKSATLPYRIHEAFIKYGHESTFLTADCDDVNAYKEVILIPGQKIHLLIARALRNLVFGKLLGKDEYYYYPEFRTSTISPQKILKLLKNKPDMIIAYWTDFFFTHEVLKGISKELNIPIMIYMMDDQPITGGCHLTFSCDKFLTGCGNCPALKISSSKDISFMSYKTKKKSIEDYNPLIVAATSYSYDKLLKTNLYNESSKKKVFLPIDHNTYKPHNNIGELKSKFNIPINKKIILFGAASYDRPNKGMKYLIEALNMLYMQMPDPTEIHILIVGEGKISEDILFEKTTLGYLSSSEEMAEAYQVSDMFVCPTIHDAGPAMINESILCGTPVVSFDTGVAKDLITDLVSGYIVKNITAKALAEGIFKLLEYINNNNNVSSDCREIGLIVSNEENQINKLISIGLERMQHE